MKRLLFCWLVISRIPTQAYDAPVGIPEPQWGTLNPIEVGRPAPPADWTSNKTDYYYVAPGGTNSGNGYPGSPRGSIPTLAPGAKVFLDGSFGAMTVVAAGTESAPVWITSYDTANQAVLTGKMTIDGSCSYLLIDQLRTNFIGSGNGKFEVASGADHIAWRTIDLGGVAPANGTSTKGDSAENQGGFSINSSNANRTNNLVIYGCNVHDTGNLNYAAGDPDAHQVSMGMWTDDVWILDNTFSYTSGNAVQIGAGTNGQTPDADVCRRIYVGRNTAHHIAQAAFWSKRAEDVIMSENVSYAMRRNTPSNPNSGGFGGQYGPRWLWFINNTVYDCQSGIQVNSNSMGAGASTTMIYVVGNVFYNITDEQHTSGAWRSDRWQQGGCAVSIWGGTGAYVVNNTIDGCDVGVISPNSNLTFHVSNNIFSSPHAPNTGGQVLLEGDPGGANTLSNNIYEGGVYIREGSVVWTSLSSIQKGTGHINAAPVYTNETAHEYYLAEGSPGRNTLGTTAHPVYGVFQSRYGRSLSVDRSGLPRPQENSWDIGAYEGSSSRTGTHPAPPRGLRIRPPR